MNRVSDQTALVLNAKSYRESSLLIQFFTKDYGKVMAIAKGAKRHVKRNGAHDFQPFTEMLVNWYGRSTLVTLTSHRIAQTHWLQGDRAAAGFYLLELISRLTQEFDHHPEIFDATLSSLREIVAGNELAPTLRKFERLLLEHLGYGLNWDFAADTGMPVQSDTTYYLDPDSGFVSTAPHQDSTPYAGETLACIAVDEYGSPQVRREAMRILQACLNPLLGPKPLISRRLLSAKRRPLSTHSKH